MATAIADNNKNIYTATVGLLARFDTLHDYCGSRNKRVEHGVIKGYLGVDKSFAHLKTVLTFLEGRGRQDIIALINALLDYKSGGYNSFEHGVFAFVEAMCDELNMPFGVSEYPLKDVNGALAAQGINEYNTILDSIPSFTHNQSRAYVYDTSDINLNIICSTKPSEYNSFQPKVLVTTAMRFDKSGKKSKASCAEYLADNEKPYQLDKSAAELLQYDLVKMEKGVVELWNKGQVLKRSM